jgi:hypothetical protein
MRFTLSGFPVQITHEEDLVILFTEPRTDAERTHWKATFQRCHDAAVAADRASNKAAA